MSDSEMEDYGFEYSDEEPEDEDIDIENQYYNSKGLLESEGETSDSLQSALEGFQQVLTMEDQKGEWGFKALKQIVKLQYRLGKHDEMLESYKLMLSYLEQAVTKNAGEKKIHSLLDWIGHAQEPGLLQAFYTVTLDALALVRNDRLWFKTQLKLAYLLFVSGEYDKLQTALDALYKACSGKDGVEDQRKGTQLLELYALEIQVATEQKRMKKLAELYERALGVESGIPHPRIMGVVRECGGKMHMRAHQWAKAATDFFEAFKNYDEAGNGRRVACLKYLVLAHLLDPDSAVDPFDSQEAQAYRNEPEIMAMTELVQAYRAHEIQKLEKILVKHKYVATQPTHGS